jgi:hypothetical protein
MIVFGFTGTQQGMTSAQMRAFRQLMKQFLAERYEYNSIRCHHGLCIGADAQAHDIVRRYFDSTIVGHPPIDTKKMVKLHCDELREPKDYIARNHDIVDETPQLVAAPHSKFEKNRSGTWATVRYARKLKRPIYIIQPSGNIVMENVNGDNG